MTRESITWEIEGGELNGEGGVCEEAYPLQWATDPWWLRVASRINCYSITALDELHDYVRACGGTLVVEEDDETS
jgi:hypothetical protein